MTIVNQPFGNQPSSPAPTPAPAPAQTVEDEAPKPLTEVFSGYFMVMQLHKRQGMNLQNS